jgi:MFS family permease
VFAGLAPNIYFALIALVIAGAADMVSGLFRSLVWNTTIPLEMRGRLAGIEMLSYSVGPQLGQIRSTFFAKIFNLRVSLITGGILCIASAGSLALSLKTIWEFDDQTNEFAIREREVRSENP